MLGVAQGLNAGSLARGAITRNVALPSVGGIFQHERAGMVGWLVSTGLPGAGAEPRGGIVSGGHAAALMSGAFGEREERLVLSFSTSAPPPKIAVTSAQAVLTGTAFPICFVTSVAVPTNS